MMHFPTAIVTKSFSYSVSELHVEQRSETTC